MRFSGTVNADTRYTFTGQFIEAAAIFARRARAIEDGFSGELSEEDRCVHRAYVSTAVMQCAAAFETESHEICVHGPGSHLGSNGTDENARRFLQPLADAVDDQSTIARYDMILHVLGKTPLDRNKEPYQSALLLVRLRNELIHYKSHWGEEMTGIKLHKSLESLRHKPPPFVATNMNFFPHHCLGADCASWAVRSAIAFLDAVYGALGVPSRFESYRQRLQV
jgi:hypothetical protein